MKVAVEVGAPDTDELEDFLEAAEELERRLDAEPGIVVRRLTKMLRRQSEFGRLRDQFGVEAGR